MTKSTEDLCQHIPKVGSNRLAFALAGRLSLGCLQAHLVKELGGSSEWRWKYPPIVPGENAPQQCVFSCTITISLLALTAFALLCNRDGAGRKVRTSPKRGSRFQQD